MAAQTRYGAIKSAPLHKDCKQYPHSQVPAAAKAAGSTETAAYLANLSRLAYAHFSRQLQRNQDFGNFDTGVVSKIEDFDSAA